MTNRSKARGTYGETLLVRWLRDNGFPGADRQPPRGNRDTGDIDLCPGIIIEAKNYNGAPGLGQPPANTLTKWLRECDTEMMNAGAAYCPLVVKRTGTTDPGRWFAYLPLGALFSLAGKTVSAYPAGEPVCVTVATLTAVLRHAGYGNPPEDN